MFTKLKMKTCKICKICKESKPVSEFYIKGSSLKSYCKVCDRARATTWRKNNLEKAKITARKAHIRRLYGITLEQYEKLLDQQNGCCAICDRHHSEFPKSLCVDHVHSGENKGAIRGLLCSNCNHRLIGDRIDGALFRKMADYVEQHTGLFIEKD